MMHGDLPSLPPIDLGGGHTLDIEHFLTHDYADIGEAMEQLPAVIEHVNWRLQVLTEQRIIAKQSVKKAEATTYFLLRSGGFENLYSGKMTDIALTHAVQLDGEVVKAHENLAILAAWTSRLANTIITLQLKLDLVRSTEATRRALVRQEED